MARMNGIVDCIESKLDITSPEISAATDGALPLYGTWISFTPAIILNNSPPKCGELPIPKDA